MNIVIIDDKEDIQYAVEKILQKEGHTCYGFYGNEDDLLDIFDVFDIELVIMDMMLEGNQTGLDILDELRKNQINIPIIMITAYTTPSNMIKASKSGINDIIQKPFSANEIIEIVKKYINNTQQEDSLSLSQGDEDFIGSFKTMKDVYKNIGIAANSMENVFIYGDTGTGKDLVAKLIYKNSKQQNFPFVAVNCSTIPENLFEKLMFGRIDNYFKNDSSKHIGYIEQCAEGVLFLDEIYNLSTQSQLKLLRFLETKNYYPLGATVEHNFQGRIICTSIMNPKQLLDVKKFRDDLYYRISTLEIGLPNLENRKDDIGALSDYFIKLYNNKLNLNYQSIDNDAVNILKNTIFNGNIRELKSTIYKAMISSSETSITSKNLNSILSKECETESMNLHNISHMLLKLYNYENIDQLFIDIEKELLKILLDRDNNISSLSKMLHMSRNTLKNKIKKYNL